MSAPELLRARRPLSYGEPSNREPCEGRQASPSNPTKAHVPQHLPRHTPRLAETVVMRCTTAEKRQLKQAAKASRVTVSELLRSTLGLVKPPRRRPAPKADPALVVALSRIGTNLNQVARVVNAAQAAGDIRQLDALAVTATLVSLDRQLADVLAEHRSDQPSGIASGKSDPC